MKPLIDEIADVLTPNNGIGLVQEEQLFQLQPLLPLSQIIEMGNDLNEEGQKVLLNFLKHKDTVIINGIVYVKTRGLNFKGRLQEILTLYHQQLKNIIGEKQILIKLYDILTVDDIINLVEDHVIFVLKTTANSTAKQLAAIRYLPSYEIKYRSRVYKFPGCMIAIAISNDFALDDVEVIAEGFNYEHPFVYRDRYKLGQRICMGDFVNSSDSNRIHTLNFANKVNHIIKQATQILLTGYAGGSHANGSLDDSKFQKYIVSK